MWPCDRRGGGGFFGGAAWGGGGEKGAKKPKKNFFFFGGFWGGGPLFLFFLFCLPGPRGGMAAGRGGSTSRLRSSCRKTGCSICAKSAPARGNPALSGRKDRGKQKPRGPAREQEQSLAQTGKVKAGERGEMGRMLRSGPGGGRPGARRVMAPVAGTERAVRVGVAWSLTLGGATGGARDSGRRCRPRGERTARAPFFFFWVFFFGGRHLSLIAHSFNRSPWVRKSIVGGNESTARGRGGGGGGGGGGNPPPPTRNFFGGDRGTDIFSDPQSKGSGF